MSPLGHNFACVAYLNTVASFWFREQLYNLNVVEFYLLTLRDLVVFFFCCCCCCFILSMPPCGEKVKI